MQAARVTDRKRETIAACVITLNEEERLAECLESVSFCDEIIVVDSGSADRTVVLAERSGATVSVHPWQGFAMQRNLALDQANSDWILEIDADERISEELRDEILAFLACAPAELDLAAMPMRDIFLGRALGLSSRYPKYRHRLFRRGSYRHDESRAVHEGIDPEGPVHPFTADMTHLLAASWSEAFADAWRYARLETSQLRVDLPSFWPQILAYAFLRPAVKLVYRVTVGGGWRDGWRGLVKVSLDCVVDTIAWLGVAFAGGARRPRARRDARSPESAPAPHLVGIAVGRRSQLAAIEWLAAAAQAGADVALVVPSTGDSDSDQTVRRRRLRSTGPIGLVRALDAEDQLRAIDAVVPFGLCARALLRVAPLALPGGRPRTLPSGSDPAQRIGARNG